MRSGARLLETQEESRERESRARKRKELRFVVEDLRNIRKRLEAVELSAARWGYPGNAALLVTLLNDWEAHICATHNIGRTT